MALTKRTSISLFTGAGGLDLGLAAAGFTPLACVESDSDARATLSKNHTTEPGWNIVEPGDIHELVKREPTEIRRLLGVDSQGVELLCGGPPCQPFSKSGYWAHGDAKRLEDPRSKTLKEYLRLVALLRPQVVLVENVRGLAYREKGEGLELLLKGLSEINEAGKSNYAPVVFNLNAAWFGVPQLRERTFLVAERDGRKFVPPVPTHGEADHLARPVTAWDAIGSLDGAAATADLQPTGKWARLLPSIPEGENYLWHSEEGGGEPIFGWRTRFWSFLLKLAKGLPSWTIQASPGPATGPFHWKNRLLSVEELLRLQTFPSGYKVVGDRRSAQRQIGNAVPSLLAEVLGVELQVQFFNETRPSGFRLSVNSRSDRPAPESVADVPAEYLAMRGKARAHPGEGLGPGALRRAQKLAEAAELGNALDIGTRPDVEHLLDAEDREAG